MNISHHSLEPVVIIGKSGITPAILAKIKEQLKKRRIIKIKFLRSAITGKKEELFAKLAKDVNARLIHHVGFVVVLERLK